TPPATPRRTASRGGACARAARGRSHRTSSFLLNWRPRCRVLNTRSAMCQLLGMSSSANAAITFSFTGFAQRGGRTDDHADGWGIAFYERSGCRVFLDDQPACESPLAEFVGRYPIKSKIVLAHIRKATQGEPMLSNCHPFQREWLGQSWIFATNGDLRHFHPPLDGPYQPVGSTDSEKAFCWLL